MNRYLPMLAAIVLLLAACEPPPEPGATDSARAHAERHFDADYVCPMHPDVTADEPGDCPVCGMDLVLRQASAAGATESAREHAERHFDPDYVCPMHPDVTAGEPGDCPVCGMDLVLRQASAAGATESAREHVMRHFDPEYVCPMHPDVTADEPGDCPVCGMDLVLRQPADQAGEAATGITVDPAVRHNLGLRVATVESGPLPRHVHAPGFVRYDESRLRHVHTRAEGWIESLAVSSVGDRVEAGQLLFEIFSPVLAGAEEEYVQALRMGGEGLIAASANRLRALGIEEAAITRLRRDREVDGRVGFHAPFAGVVIGLDARQGMFVRPMTDVIVLADLSRVWVEADVLARESGWLRSGLAAEVRTPGADPRVLEGRVGYVYPEVDAVSRALRVRLEFDNPDGRLMPSSFVSVRITEADAAEVLHIPSAAVIRSGRGERVIVESAPGSFTPRAVQVAFESEGRSAISAGLEPGETVVVSGQFMIDSEASLRGELERLGAPSSDAGQGTGGQP